MMHAIIQDSFGPPEVLRLAQIEVPQLREGEVLIRVEASGVSRADILQRQGKYPPPQGASPILGLDVAGTVEAVARDVPRFKPRDRICALVAGGGYAEFCAVPQQQVLPVPEGWSAVEAVTLPENLFTVYDNVITRAGLKPGERLLVHGGTSGIGSMAVMLARAVRAIPYATAGSDAKCEDGIRLGAEGAINYRTSDFVEELRKLTGGHGADVVLDLVGGPYLERNVEVLAMEGRLALIATLGGTTGTLPIHKLMAKRGTIVASTLRARTPDEKGAIAARLLRDIWPLLPAKQSIRPVLDSVYPLADAAKAHERLEGGAHVGKIVLVP